MKPRTPTLAEALACADVWAKSESYSNMATFRRCGVVLAKEVRALEEENEQLHAALRAATAPSIQPTPTPARGWFARAFG